MSGRFRFALLLALATASLTGVVDARADESAPTNVTAQEDYTAGRESYRLGLYGRALEQFERALARVSSPNTSLYIARTLRELGRWTDAAEVYRTTIREAQERGGKYAATREAAEMELADVMARLGHVESAPPTRAPAEIAPASPSTERAPPFARSGEVRGPGREMRHVNALTWTSGGVAVAGAASFAVLYALASDRYSYLEDHCAVARDASCESARSAGKTEEVVAYVSLGVAVVAAIGTVVSVAIPASTSAAAARRSPAWRLTF